MRPMSAETFQRSTIERLRVASSAGTLHARVIRPLLIRRRPLLVLHGISRNARELTQLFRKEAERTGRPVIVPHFKQKDWPHFQRPSAAARPDQAILELLNVIAATHPEYGRNFDVFGHSGGAQLAHRLAMLYPQRFGTVSLAAAGWYCLPDESMPYPYGLAPGEMKDAVDWIRRKRAGLDAYLRLPLRIYVGDEDIERDEALRTGAALDAGQGRTRRDRAHAYARAVRGAAERRGIAPDVTMTELPGCHHDVEQSITEGGLARLVTGPAPVGFGRTLS
ncbi:Pimeloyl-ACP methyl ester carboxylesterase [Roseivivax halotolerans]|uniref:Pimeloyl-ACP methyl ester carboxylesterase n=2 Tax=Roseivivax halotolerans TaxID=93684 RepID=A0A1I6A5L7_9RHOB|nr:Pimeloyl-ACP methyl ester carboxylesterase [Roseivivax halotolerans]